MSPSLPPSLPYPSLSLSLSFFFLVFVWYFFCTSWTVRYIKTAQGSWRILWSHEVSVISPLIYLLLHHPSRLSGDIFLCPAGQSVHRWVVSSVSSSQVIMKWTNFFLPFFFSITFYTYYPNSIPPVGNSGCLPRGKPAATESRYRTYGTWITGSLTFAQM